MTTMDAIFFFFRWLNGEAGASVLGRGAVKYAAWAFDSYMFYTIGLLLILGLSSIPKEGVMTFLAAVLYTLLVWLHFDAAYWRDSLPATSPEIVLTTVGVMVIPTLSFVITGWAWKARHHH